MGLILALTIGHPFLQHNKKVTSLLLQTSVVFLGFNVNLEHALQGRHHAFSNVSDTIAELHEGVNKSHPCGAGLGLVGVGPSGDISPCHRFVDSDSHKLGHVSTGIDRSAQRDFLARGHIDTKYDCHTCWARPLCAGGCHHEAYVRYGDTGHANPPVWARWPAPLGLTM